MKLTNKLLTLNFKTERLCLRPLQRKDYQNWCQSFTSTLPAQNIFDTDNLERSEITYHNFLSILQEDKEKISQGITFNFYAFSLTDDKLIGSAQLWCIQRGHCQRAVLGYSVFNNHWRKGYGTEIAQGLINHGIIKLNLNRIEAEIDSRNKPSIALCKKIGMISEGIRRNSLFEDGEWRNHTIFSITAKDLGIDNRPPDLNLKSLI